MNSRTCTTLSEAQGPSAARRPAFHGAAAPRAAAAVLAAALAAACLTGCVANRPDPDQGTAEEGAAAAASMAAQAHGSAAAQESQGRSGQTGRTSARRPEKARNRQANPVWGLPTEPGENGEGSITFRYSNKSTDAGLILDLGTTDLYLEMSGKPAEALAEEAKAADREPEPQSDPRKRIPRAQPQPDIPDEQEEAPSQDPDPRRSAMHSRSRPQPGTPDPRNPAKPENPLPADDPGDYEDVTAKVLTGIRKAQELFYQKRYPEAMQAVRSSLDARSTAEGHALAGSIHYMQGQGGMARREWMEALRLNPDMPAVVNMLERTRTPGGRGSPSPRPLPPRPVARAAPLPLPEGEQAPYPEEYEAQPEGNPVPAKAAEAAQGREEKAR